MNPDFWGSRSGAAPGDDASVLAVEPARPVIRESDGTALRLTVRRASGEERPLRIWAESPWLEVAPAELPAGSDEVTVVFRRDWLDMADSLPEKLETVLRIGVLPSRALEFSAPPPSVSVPLVVELTLPDPTGEKAEVASPAGMGTDARPAAIMVSAAEIVADRVPVDSSVDRTITVTWAAGEPALLRVDRDVVWLQVSPAHLDFRHGPLSRDIKVRIDGRALQSDGEEVGLVVVRGDVICETITIRATREFAENVQAKIERVRSAATLASLGLLCLYVLALLLRWEVPLSAVALPLGSVAAAAAGLITWRKQGDAAPVWVGSAVAAALLVAGFARVPEFARHLALVAIPAAGVPLARTIAGSLAASRPSATWVGAVAPAAVGLMAYGVIAGALGIRPGPGAAPEHMERVREAAGDVNAGGERTGATEEMATRPRAAPVSSDASPEGSEARPAARSQTEAAIESEPSATLADPVPTGLGALRKYVRTHPEDVKALNRLAELELGAGSTAAALRCWRASLAISPDQHEVSRRVAELAGD